MFCLFLVYIAYCASVLCSCFFRPSYSDLAFLCFSDGQNSLLKSKFQRIFLAFSLFFCVSGSQSLRLPRRSLLAEYPCLTPCGAFSILGFRSFYGLIPSPIPLDTSSNPTLSCLKSTLSIKSLRLSVLTTSLGFCFFVYRFADPFSSSF